MDVCSCVVLYVDGSICTGRRCVCVCVYELVYTVVDIYVWMLVCLAIFLSS